MSVDFTPQLTCLEPATIRQAILSTLSYADVFDYPLTAPEVHRYLTLEPATLPQVAHALDELVASGAVVRLGEYFALRGRASLFATRRSRAEIASRLWQKAVKYGRLIAALPFARMVAVTGSLAMCNTDPGTDIDLLLVTTPNRLWTCRALVILLTRLAALEGVTLCPNYMVTTNALTFHERSLYVAHEVTQMIPLAGSAVYDRLRDLNAWTRDYLPNALGAPQLSAPTEEIPRWQRLAEVALAILPTRWFEAWEMRRKVGHLSRRQSFSPEACFSADICKGHKDQHMQRTENALRARLESLSLL